MSIYTNIDGAPRRISGKCGKRRKFRKCRDFRDLRGNPYGGFGTSIRPILPVFITFPLRGGVGVGWGGRGGPFSGMHYRVFAAENGNYPRRPLEAECPSIPTSTGRPRGFAGNAASAKAPKVPGFSPFSGKTLWGFGNLIRMIFCQFVSCFRLGGGPFPGRHFRVFADENGTYPRQPLEGACPSIPTSTGNRVGFCEMRKACKVPKAPKVHGFSLFLGKSLGRIRRLSETNFTCFAMRPLRGEPFSGWNPRVFAAENGKPSWRLLEAEGPPIPTSPGNPCGFLGNPGSEESAGIFAIFGKILRVERRFTKGSVTSFYDVSAYVGELASPECISVCLWVKTVLIPGAS